MVFAMSNITGLNHITLAVTDLDMSIPFYRDLLGFQVVAQWSRGAYLIMQNLWLCLSLDSNRDDEASSDYSHIAFSIDAADFVPMAKNIRQQGIVEWQENSSFGDSLYILDPDGHKLEIHSSTLIARLAHMKQNPSPGQQLFDANLNLRRIPIPEWLANERVTLVPMELSHVEGLYKAGKPKQIWQWMPRPFESVDDTHAWVIDALEDPSQVPFTILDKDDNIIGSTRYLDIDPSNRSLEIGWTWLHPDHWNTPTNPACKYLLLSHAFEELNYIRVQLKTDIRNIRSQKAMEKIGATREGVLRANMLLPNGHQRDSVYYSILASEWHESVKRKLLV